MKTKYHPLVLVAFIYSCLTLSPLPIADYLAVHPSHSALPEAYLASTLNAIAVAVLLAIAQRQTRRHPDKYKPRALSLITWAILFLGVAFNGIVLFQAASKR